VDALPSRGVEVEVRRKVLNVDSESGMFFGLLDLRWNKEFVMDCVC